MLAEGENKRKRGAVWCVAFGGGHMGQKEEPGGEILP